MQRCDYCHQETTAFDEWTDGDGKGRKCRERCADVAFITLTINRRGSGQ